MKLIKYTGQACCAKKIYSFVKKQCLINGNPFSNVDETEFIKSKFDETYLQNKNQFLCLFYEDQLIGTIAIKGISDNIAEIRRFYIDESYQKQGLGKLLIFHIFRFIQKCGYTTIRCTTSEKAKTCLSIIKQNGFIPIKKYRNSRAQLFFEKKICSKKESCAQLSKNLADSLQLQEKQFENSLILNPVENIPFKDTLYPATSFLHGIYCTDSIRNMSDKLKSKIQFAGRTTICEDVNSIYKTWSKLLEASNVTMRLLSGLHAHTTLFMSISSIGDKIVLLPEKAGGHFSTLKILERLGLNVKCLPIDLKNMRIDKVASKTLIDDFKPKFIFIDRSEGLIYEDFSWLAQYMEIYKIFDASQYLTNIIADDYVNPFINGFDMILSTTHKNLPGPQMALIAVKNSDDMYWAKLKSGISTYVSNMHVFNIYSAGLLLKHYDKLVKLSSQMLFNTITLEKKLFELDVPVISRQASLIEPPTHHIWIKLPDAETAYNLFYKLESLGINVNYRLLPYDLGYGLRLGLSGATRSGLKSVNDINFLAEIISRAYKGEDIEDVEVKELINRIKTNE